MQKVISERNINIQYLEDIKLSALLFEEFAQIYGIPNVTVDQVRLILSELLNSIRKNYNQERQKTTISVTFKLFEQGSLSIKIVNKGVLFNPFEENILSSNRFVNDFKIDTLGFHLARKYMDVCTYHRALGYNIIYMKKEQV